MIQYETYRQHNAELQKIAAHSLLVREAREAQREARREAQRGTAGAARANDGRRPGALSRLIGGRRAQQAPAGLR